LAKLAQSYWILALIGIVTVVVLVHAIFNRHDLVNWLGVALWIILFITVLRRRLRAGQPPPGRPKSRRK
jgi:hypothetical protein